MQGPLPTVQPIASPSASPGHVYLSNEQGPTPETISVFTLPITNASTSVAQIAGNNGPVGMAFDATPRLFVANRPGATGTGNVQIFTMPITNGATPAFILTVGSTVCVPTGCGSSAALDVALDQAGDLFVVGRQPYVICPSIRCPELAIGGMLVGFTAPVTSSSAPSFEFSGGGAVLLGVALDHNGNLWVTGEDGGLRELTPPFSNGSRGFALAANATGGVAFDSAGSMYVSAGDGVDVYQPPFSNSMTKAFTIRATTPQYLAFDAAGNLYVTSGSNVLVFAQPFNGTSAPFVTLAPPGSAFGGVAIGP